MEAPQHRLFVFAAAGQCLAICRKGDTHDFASVALELLGWLARRNVPQANRLIITAGKYAAAVA